MTKIPGTPEQLLARRKWVDALRSGKYAQTKTRLQSFNGFCCLGVACDISGLGYWADDRSFTIGDASAIASPLPGVWDQLGISKSYERLFWRKNDFEDKTFPEIADFIETKWEVAPAT